MHEQDFAYTVEGKTKFKIPERRCVHRGIAGLGQGFSQVSGGDTFENTPKCVLKAQI